MEKKIADTRLRWYFLIGAAVGVVLFVVIYGFRVLNVTYDEWLLTGKDLQQHYLGWKFFRRSPWSFPVGMHDSFTSPDSISVLYTDSIPLFALFFKLLSPILPETFQYFGLFGLMCYILNGGFASVLVARFNKSKFICGMSSVFFIISTPVLQRLFGVLSENSRHTSLAAHFLILGALGIWMYRDHFKSYKKDALAWAILAALCVLIQMYIIFMVGGIMCGYLLQHVLEKRDWKRVIVDFASFVGSFGFFFLTVGGVTSILSSGGSGFGFFSANVNTFINPWRYSTFFGKMKTQELQYEGFAYLGLGMLVMCAIALTCIIVKMVRLKKQKHLWLAIRNKVMAKRPIVISLGIVVYVFTILAWSNLIYINENIFIEVHWPEFLEDLLAIIRSSGRFIWCVMYMIMLGAIFIVTKSFKRRWQFIIIGLCMCLQLADFHVPINRLQALYKKQPAVKEEALVESDFWTTKLGDFDKIVYYPSDSYDATQMLQIGAKVAEFDHIKMSNFYLSRYMTKEAKKERDKKTKELFETGNLDENTLYLLDYAKAHVYKDKCHMYFVDNKIIAVKNPIKGLDPYVDFMVGSENQVVEIGLAYKDLGKSFLHTGWHNQQYKDIGAWTTSKSQLRIYSEDAKRAKITIEYDARKNKKGLTVVKMNNIEIGRIQNDTSGTVTFESDMRICEDIKKARYINWLSFECNAVKEPKKAGESAGKGLRIKKVTVTYMPDDKEEQ